MGAETRTIGELIDSLSICNIRIWMLTDKVIAGLATVDEAQKLQKVNQQRNELVRAIDRSLGQRDIGGKDYA